MRIIEKIGTGRKRKRKQAEIAKKRAGVIPHLSAVLLIAFFVILSLPLQPWSGRGAAGKETGPRIRLHFEINPQQMVASLAGSIKAASINSYFSRKGSPLAGFGTVFVDAERETGVSADLVAAITLVESSCATDGSLSETNHNAWGMKGPQPALGIPADNGFCWWPDWPSAIHGAARFILNYWGPSSSANELRGYAAGSGSWAGNVESARQTII